MRRDYAIFSDDKLVTNALLTVREVERMEAEGYRCLRVTAGDGLPEFRGGFSRSGSVARRLGNGGRWDR